MLLASFYFALSALAANACTDDQLNTCDTNQCETLGTTQICIQCKTAGHVPINGVCKQKGDEVSNAGCKNNAGAEISTEKTCGQCDGAYFLYKGGCYGTNNEIGQKLCTAASGGVCTKAAAGYFIPPGAVKTDPSVMACNDTAELTLTDTKKYVGVQHCTVCAAPGAADSTAKPAVCTECSEGFFVASEGATCTACTDANCAKCGKVGQKQCSECKAGNDKVYLKVEADSETGECIEKTNCNGDYFPNDNVGGKKQCIACGSGAHGGVADCKTCTLKEKPEGSILVTCSSCTTDTNKPNIDGTKCIACAVKDCKRCNDDGTCAECNDSKKLSPLRDLCLENCPVGTYTDRGSDGIGVCTLCHNTCAECNGKADATACTACYPGYSLLYGSDTTGTCVKECTGQFSANCAEATCSAKVGGSSYCAQCKDGYAPIDGVCTEVKAPAGRNQDICTASGGKCTACKGAYALISDGCYSVNKLPGKSVCTVANNGECTTCANEQIHNKGTCPACSDGCLKCKDNVVTCTECYSGYYLSSSKCFKCTNGNEADIKGVENCISCAPPAGNSGPVICYIKNDGTSGGGGSSGGGSTNKSGLSTGAIAGIAVAAIVVVGGLVGFLCWWFICRGKA